MEKFIWIIQLIAIIQIILLVILMIVILLKRITLSFFSNKKAKLIAKIEQEFKAYASKFDGVNNKSKRRYCRNIAFTLTAIRKTDQLGPHQEWEKARAELMGKIILPRIRAYVFSAHWYKRYLACLAFQLFSEKRDKKFISYLIEDSIPLVALNSARIAFLLQSQTLIDQTIACFSKNRSTQRALFIQMINIPSPALQCIANHLNRSNNIYTKIFCYQMLKEQPDFPQEIASIQSDLEDNNMDLQIAALTYFIYAHPEKVESVLSRKLKSPHMEVRAKTASLIAKTGKTTFIYLLEESLKDEHWWVRINAAEALAHLGSEGLDILKKQTPSSDQFAYDAANRVIAAIKKKTE